MSTRLSSGSRDKRDVENELLRQMDNIQLGFFNYELLRLTLISQAILQPAQHKSLF